MNSKTRVTRRMLWDERRRREELEVIAAALYLGHDDAKEQMDMYKAVYLTKQAHGADGTYETDDELREHLLDVFENRAITSLKCEKCGTLLSHFGDRDDLAEAALRCGWVVDSDVDGDKVYCHLCRENQLEVGEPSGGNINEMPKHSCSHCGNPHFCSELPFVYCSERCLDAAQPDEPIN